MAKQRVGKPTGTEAPAVIAAKIEKRRLAKNLASRKYRAKLRAQKMADNMDVTSGSEAEIVESEVESVESEVESVEPEVESVEPEVESVEPEVESVASEIESVAAAPEEEGAQERIVVDQAFAERLAEAVKPTPPISVYDSLNPTNAGPLPARPHPKQGDMWLGTLHRDRSLNAAEKLEHAPTKKIEYGERLAEEKEVEEEDLGVLGEEFGFFDEAFETIMAGRELDERMEERKKAEEDEEKRKYEEER